jgi:hypothetical protein
MEARKPSGLPCKETIYSLPALRELLAAANGRHLEFISSIDDPPSGNDKLQKLSGPAKDNDRSVPGFNFFDPDDQLLLRPLPLADTTSVAIRIKTSALIWPRKPHLDSPVNSNGFDYTD